MTYSSMLIHESHRKSSMWSKFRCKNSWIVLFLINAFVIQSILYYKEICKWDEIKQEIDIIMGNERITHTLAHSVLKRLHRIITGVDKDKLNLDENSGVIYAITPTFVRPVQKAELTRLSQTFMHIPNFHWIVVEDAPLETPLVTKLLADSDLTYTQLAAQTPKNYKLGRTDPNWKKPRGVEQRNAALRWIRDNLKTSDKGVVFFADDDNTYSIKLFNEMLKVKKVGVWPVGLVGGLMVEKPICDNATNKVLGFNSVWKPDRPFPVDMAGFAIGLNLLLENRDAWFSYEVQGGYQESAILQQLITKDQLEPLADCCTKVYVWHTRTEPPLLNAEQMLIKKGKRSNAGIEV